MYDALVIGGGFYGATIAAYLVAQRGFKRVALIEREAQLLSRASYHNQARVHNGYHYPRSYTTAYRSRVNFPRFIADFGATVRSDFTALYAIARRDSKVTARQFERFCREIGAAIEPAPPSLAGLFEPRLIEEAFLVEESVFDAVRLRDFALAQLQRLGVEILLKSRVTRLSALEDGLVAGYSDATGAAREICGRFVFNCSYSAVNQIGGAFQGIRASLKHELAEMALIDAPPGLQGLAVTVMDGPFFSMLPFPARSLCTLSHVRYTPHRQWFDLAGNDPYRVLETYERQTRVDRMIREASRYLPALREARHVDSLFEVKTVLAKNETDDGRPILFERDSALRGCFTIMGGKIDNIFDVLERLDAEPLGSP